jgi:o-succinylbenzoate---CoA ligase
MSSGERHVPDWLTRRATDRPDGLALIDGSGPDASRWTYRELDTRAATLAEDLAARSVAPGDRVAVLMANGSRYVELVHALMRRRAILVPLNIRLTAAEIAWQVKNSGARLLLHDRAQAELAGTIPTPARVNVEVDVPAWSKAQSDASPLTIHGPGAALQEGRANAVDPRLDLDAVQCIIYTSGTTGRPKGTLLSYGNHWWSAIGSALNLGLGKDDRWLACLPFFHIGGLSILMRAVIYGIPVVLPARRPEELRAVTRQSGFDPAAVNRAIEDEAVTIVSVVSAILPRMFEAQGERAYPSGLRCMLLGGGPVPRPLLEECARRGIPVTQTYGMTETASQVVTLAPGDALRKLGAAGRPLLPNELRIAPLQDVGPRTGEGIAAESANSTPHDRPAPDESAVGGAADARSYREGEILVRGPSVTKGYLTENGEITEPQAAVDGEGWLHTGDIGYLDGEGFLYVLDRRTDLIISGGENVYPAEIEAVLLTHPSIAEAGVYGIQDERWGQRAAAAVTPRVGATIDTTEVLAFCRLRLAAYKVPATIRVVESLPRNAGGKLLRRELRDI